MKQRLFSLAALTLAGAGLAQDPLALPCLRLVDGGPHSIATVSSGRPLSGDPILARAGRATTTLVAAWTVPTDGGDHPITPPVPPPERPTRSDAGDVTRPSSGGAPAPATSPGPTGPTAPAPGSTGPAPTPRTGGRGMPLDAIEATTWTHWWEWNRGVFELPEPRVVAPVLPGRTAVPVDSRPRTALTQLCRSTNVAIRVAAVQALGRVGASAQDLVPFLDDAAREVRLTALLAIGSGGTAAHAHALATWLASAQHGEAVVAALAGFALLDDGPARTMLAPSVTNLLTDSRLEVQAAVALATASRDVESGRAAARELLRDATTKRDYAFAAQVLGRSADAADVALLIELSSARNVAARRSAALALGRSHHALALKALQEALERERDVSTRSYVLLALGDHRGDGAEVVLLRELTTGSKALRAHAALALGLWGRGREGIDPIARTIAVALAAERNRDQKGAYLLALGMLRHEASRSLLVKGLAADEESSTRGAAATALGLLGGEASLEPLKQTLATDSCPGARQQAARAMALVGKSTIDALVDSLKSEKNGHVRAGALWALGSFDSAKVTETLLACVADETEPVEARAAGALALGRAFRKHEPRMPEMRFQYDNLVSPPIVGWAFGQEL